MSNDPDQIREQIELTRGSLSNDVNALADTVKPGNVARRQADKVRGAAGSARDKIMGTASDVGTATGSTFSDAGSKITDAASSSQDAVKAAPDAIRTQTRGNPLAAGLIAFGAGWLVASLIPATRAEQQAATKAKENASVVTDEVSAVAKEVGAQLKEPAQNAATSLQSTATDAVNTVKAESTSAVQDVKEQGVQAGHAVQDSRS